MKRIAIILLSSVCLGCVHNPLKESISKVPAFVCDTVQVTYKTDIEPAIRNNCYSCHATSVTAGGGLDLEDFESFKKYLEYGFRGDGIYGSKFYHCISHSLLALPMPPTYVLDSCTLKKIKRWIDFGAPNN